MTEQQRPLGRPCVTCASSERVAIEEAMLGGSSLSSIARRFGIDRMALDRHRSRHLAWSPELAREAGLAPETVVSRLVDIATRLDDDARSAWEAGDTTEHRKAAEAARRAWATVGAVGGNAAEQMSATIEAQREQVRAMAALMRRAPKVAEALAVELEARDLPVLAEALREQFLETTSSRELTA